MRSAAALVVAIGLSGCGGMGTAMGEMALRTVLTTGMSILGDVARQAAIRAVNPGFVAPIEEGRLSP